MKLTPLLLSVALLATSAARAYPITGSSTPPPRDPFAPPDPFASMVGNPSTPIRRDWFASAVVDPFAPLPRNPFALPRDPMASMVGNSLDPDWPASAVGYSFAPPSRDPFASAYSTSFADFFRANPSAAQPVGTKPFWFEALLVEVESDKIPAKNDEPPTPEMLAQGKLVRIEVRANSSASGGNFYLLDRVPPAGHLPDGSGRRKIGTQIFIYLLPDGTHVVLLAQQTEFEGWVGYGGPESLLQQPIYSTREINTQLTMSSKWIVTGRWTREHVTRKADGTEQTKKMTLLMFSRLLSEDPTKVAPATTTAAK